MNLQVSADKFLRLHKSIHLSTLHIEFGVMASKEPLMRVNNKDIHWCEHKRGKDFWERRSRQTCSLVGGR